MIILIAMYEERTPSQPQLPDSRTYSKQHLTQHTSTYIYIKTHTQTANINNKSNKVRAKIPLILIK